MRDIDALREIGKQSPLLASGLLLILAAATGVAPGFGQVQNPWQIFVGILGTLLVIAGIVYVFQSLRLGGQPLPIEKNETTEYKGKNIPIFISQHQKTDLVSRRDGLELVFHDIRGSNKSHRRFLNIDDLKNIHENGNIKVVPKSSKNPKWGVVTIGPWRNWLYSKELHTNPKNLYTKIYDLIEEIIQQNTDRRKP